MGLRSSAAEAPSGTYLNQLVYKMSKSISNFSALNLDDVCERVYEKYAVSRSDAELSVEYLRCFLDAKRGRPNDLIILPQIADWAWHELILDTARYREMCSQLFGRFLHHVRERVISERVREAFTNSLKMMQNVYGLGFGDRPIEWSEAGWDTPIYRLRNPILTPNYAYDRSGSGDDAVSDRSDGSPTGFLSWLPLRIAQRFGVPNTVARQGVREYSELFLSSQPSRVRAVPSDDRSVLCLFYRAPTATEFLYGSSIGPVLCLSRHVSDIAMAGWHCCIS
jgi:hypothetical protein